MPEALPPLANTDAPAADAPAERFLVRLAAALDADAFVKLVLAKPRAPAADGTRVAVRRLVLHGQPHLSLTRRHPTRDVTTNLAVADGVRELRRLIGHGFQHAHLFTTVEELQMLVGRKGRATLRRSPAAATIAGVAAEPAGHDRVKRRHVDLARPFLVELGVTDAGHRLIPAMARKWKQIDKFVEVLDHAIGEAGLKAAARIDVADLGCGKGYLTFALHDHLRHTLRLPATVTGVELRDDMVALCGAAAARLGLAGLRFERGDVRTWTPAPPAAAPDGPADAPRLDVMIALHACDTATDHAIHTGIRAGARVIVCSPCCHKELRPQLLAPQPLAPILRHGVHLGQQAEMLTDGLRALLLEACGYDTRVFEFVALEHTSKNKMILGVRRDAPGRADAAWAQVRELKAFYGIRDQCLERLLHAGGAAA